MNRRNLLRLTALAPLAALTPAKAFSPIKRTGGPFIKPTLNAYSFLEQLNANMKDASKGIDLFGVVDFCAKHDIEAIDLTGYFFPGYPKAPADSYINRMKRYVHDSGIVISGTGVKNDFVPADKTVRAAGVQLTKDWIEVAARLGAPVIRVFAGPTGSNQPWQELPTGPKRADVEAWMADDLRTCAEYGEKFGVLVAHLSRYATGAEVSYADRAQIRQIVESTKSNGYGLRSLIHALARSEVFNTQTMVKN